MLQLRTIIVDDEEYCRKNLTNILNYHCPEIEIVGYASSDTQLTNEIITKSPDLIFLDIEIPGKNGLEVLSEIKDKSFIVIVVTGQKKYGIRAVKENVLDYILKPLDEDEVKQAVQKAASRFIEEKNNKIKDKLLLKVHSGFKVFQLDDIIYFEGKDNYTEVYHTSGSLLVSKTLKEYDDILKYGDFFRIHKKYLINLKHVSEFSYKDGGFVIMSNDECLNISRMRLKDFVKRIKFYALNTNLS